MPALVTVTRSPSPARRRCSSNTSAAIGDRQMFPVQMKDRCTSYSLKWLTRRRYVVAGWRGRVVGGTLAAWKPATASA
ncbi:hypothetical protein GCM10010470_08050 [Saccharopolyspora taberi]|uniref:Uncharacterized protein n=1 Tax=Saccharopolyspora taberi TaxID=60895 RepID=A0ABN3V3Z1_9PSEU